jgi:hypothetical protein
MKKAARSAVPDLSVLWLICWNVKASTSPQETGRLWPGRPTPLYPQPSERPGHHIALEKAAYQGGL